MARRSHVPKFGNWDANDHMPYTAVFDHARNGRGKPMINPNDPSENPEAFGMKNTNGGAPGRRAFNPNDPDDVEAFDPPVPNNRAHAPPRRAAPQSYRPPSDRIESPSASFSADQSPSHPLSSQVKKPAVGGASPAWENNGSNNRRKLTGDEATFAPATPTRSRLRTGGSNKSDDGSQKGAAALPKFGAWNAQDPNSGDGFTVIFNNARNERKAGGPVRIPQPNENTHDSDLYNQQHVPLRQSSRKWLCCFGGSRAHS